MIAAQEDSSADFGESAVKAPSNREERNSDGSSRAHRDLEAVRRIAEPMAAEHGLELIDVEWSTARGSQILRITIDRVDGDADGPATDTSSPAGEAILAVEGVTLDDCVRLTRDLSATLDVEDVVSVRYTLEVSSPGLDRPLRSARDFRRQRGRLAKVKLREPAADGQQVLRGRLLEVSDTSFTMDVDGNVHDVRLEDVGEAKLVFELPNQKKQAPRRRKSKGSRR